MRSSGSPRRSGTRDAVTRSRGSCVPGIGPQRERPAQIHVAADREPVDRSAPVPSTSIARLPPAPSTWLPLTANAPLLEELASAPPVPLGRGTSSNALARPTRVRPPGAVAQPSQVSGCGSTSPAMARRYRVLGDSVSRGWGRCLTAAGRAVRSGTLCRYHFFLVNVMSVGPGLGVTLLVKRTVS